LKIRQLAGWLTHEEAEELRTSLDVLNFIVVDQIDTIIVSIANFPSRLVIKLRVFDARRLQNKSLTLLPHCSTKY
jgi:hypothetical protein